MFDRPRIPVVLLLAGLAAGCSKQGPPAADLAPPAHRGSVLLGTVSYRERIALPPDAVLEVTLRDVTPGTPIVPALAARTIAVEGRQAPIPFELLYDRAHIRSGRFYALHAVIREAAGRDLFATTEPFGIDFPLRSEGVTVLLHQVKQSGEDVPRTLAGTRWRLVDLGGTGVLDGVPTTLEFMADGKVGGRGSCNRWFSTATIDGDQLAFAAIGATKMACADSVMAQESKYFTALEGARRFEFEGTALLVHAKGLEKPLRFVPSTDTAP
jgi:putative lipoprotein